MNKFTEAQQKFFSKLKVGQKIIGTVVRFLNHGAVIRLGIINGFLANKDISWARVQDPEDFLKLHKKLETIILSTDQNKQHVTLGLKQLQQHPWDIARTKYKEGDTVVGQVVDIHPYGAFLQIFPGFEGLVHISEIASGKIITDAKEYFEPEQAYEAVILKLDFENRKMALSIK